MIKGMGTDIVAIARFARLYEKYPERCLTRILSPSECHYAASLKNPVLFLAKRFALKEAFVKALGTGFRGVGFHDFSILPDTLGAPKLSPSLRLQERLNTLGITQVHLSVSDEKEYAVAFVILE